MAKSSWVFVKEEGWLFLNIQGQKALAGVHTKGPPFEATVMIPGALDLLERDDIETLAEGVSWCEKHLSRAFPSIVFNRTAITSLLETEAEPKPTFDFGVRHPKPPRCHRCRGEKTVVGPASRDFKDVVCPVCHGKTRRS